jgi:hypothetical protein
MKFEIIVIVCLMVMVKYHENKVLMWQCNTSIFRYHSPFDTQYQTALPLILRMSRTITQIVSFLKDLEVIRKVSRLCTLYIKAFLAYRFWYYSTDYNWSLSNGKSIMKSIYGIRTMLSLVSARNLMIATLSNGVIVFENHEKKYEPLKGSSTEAG